MFSQLEQEFQKLQHGAHVCHIHENAAEQTRNGVVFTRIGLECGECCVYIADHSTYDELVSVFAAEGVDLASQQRKGALTILQRRDAYLRSGEFVAQEMIDYLVQAEREALEKGYSGFRLQAEMTWALDADISRDRLIEYESALNEYLKSSHAVVACSYLKKRIDAASMQDVLVSHPTVVVTDHVCPNPYFEPIDFPLRTAPIAMSEFKRKRFGWWIAKLQAAMLSEPVTGSTSQSALQQDELIQNLLDSTDEAIYGIDLEGRCRLANPTCARLLGYASAADLTGQFMHQLIHHRREDGSTHPIEECPIHRILTTQKGTRKGSDVFWRADGSALNVEYWAYPMWRDEVFIGVVVTFLDISHKKALEQQLRSAHKMEEIGRLAGGVAHDFNNMLTVITGYSELLLNLTPLDDPKREYLEEIRKAGTRSASLTRQLLALNRTQVQSPKELDLNGVIRDMEKMLRRVIGEDIVMSTRLNPDLQHIMADASEMEQILLNLMINARDAMPQGGSIRIETDNVTVGAAETANTTGLPPGRYVRLSLADSGPGMTDFVKSQLFEPFFTTKAAGTGLGLPVVHGIVTQSGGRIEVASKPGAGTVFHIYLPQAERPVSMRKSKGVLRESLRGTDTILLVEDDDAVRAFAKFTLQGYGYKVLEAANASEAFRICGSATVPIHLLLTDVVMPETSGRIVAETLSDIYPGMRILFMSGYTNDAVLRHGIAHEQVNFLQKPFSATELAHKVRDVLTA
jgi:PAS domain S-box-containing protein